MENKKLTLPSASEVERGFHPLSHLRFLRKLGGGRRKPAFFALSTLPEKLGICHLSKNIPIPEWAEDISLCSITRTSDELSIVCPQEKIPAGVMAELNWRAFKLEGDLGMASVGVIASLAKPLAEANISIFNISTYETNYVLVEEKNFEKAKKILSEFCNIKQLRL